MKVQRGRSSAPAMESPKCRETKVDDEEKTEVGLFQEMKIPEFTNLTQVSLFGPIRRWKSSD